MTEFKQEEGIHLRRFEIVHCPKIVQAWFMYSTMSSNWLQNKHYDLSLSSH